MIIINCSFIGVINISFLVVVGLVVWEGLHSHPNLQYQRALANYEQTQVNGIISISWEIVVVITALLKLSGVISPLTKLTL